MNSHAILTAIGADRPGLVEEVSQYIFDRGGNIEDSRMVNLRGQFAMMVLVSGGTETLERVGKDASSLSRSGLHVELRPASATPRAGNAQQAVPYRLHGSGIDQAGLVHRLAQVLREMNVNIESLDTELKAAPYTGAPVFDMDLVLAVPKTTPVSALRQKIGATCDEMNIDWVLEAL